MEGSFCRFYRQVLRQAIKVVKYISSFVIERLCVFILCTILNRGVWENAMRIYQALGSAHYHGN